MVNKVIVVQVCPSTSSG